MTAPQAYQTTELVHCQDSSSASDVFAFAIAMWECFSYGQTPWRGMTNDQVRDCPRGNRVTEENEEKKILFVFFRLLIGTIQPIINDYQGHLMPHLNSIKSCFFVGNMNHLNVQHFLN